jgi:hypothetical protein
MRYILPSDHNTGALDDASREDKDVFMRGGRREG